MRRESIFLKLSPVLTLALIGALTLSANGGSALAVSAQATSAANAPQFPMCMPPTPTPTAVGATPAVTGPAPVATTAPTTAAAAPTMAATTVPTATKVPPTPTATPTATKLVTGQKPATALIAVNGDPTMLLNGKHCIKVVGVTAGGPAALAGIKTGDYVLGVDAVTVASPADFFAALNKHVSGDVVIITVQRGSSEMALKTTLGAVAT